MSEQLSESIGCAVHQHRKPFADDKGHMLDPSPKGSPAILSDSDVNFVTFRGAGTDTNNSSSRAGAAPAITS